MTEIRTIREDDLPQVMDLVAKVDFPYRSKAGWHWALFGNPQQGDIPTGFVAERAGEVVSMIGLQARDFCYNGAIIKAATGHTFISGRKGRGSGVQLAKRAISYPGLASVYSLNNNASSAGLYKKLGLDAWLNEAGRHRVDWPARPLIMAAGLCFSRLARADRFYDALSSREWFNGRTAPLRQIAIDLLSEKDRLDPANETDADLIESFNASICEVRSVAPVRSAEFYSYQMADPDAPGRSVLLTVRDGNRVLGLMQVILTKPNAFEPAELEITDLELHPDAPRSRAIGHLVRNARKIARAAGAGRLRLLLSGRFLREDLSQTGYHVQRRYSYDPAHASFGEGMERFGEAWEPTGFEGDFHFALRVAP
ncbi:GNAT family N-acetyltransferase [Henriciella marina]|uniref:GNAT family N-acetyltransferase n=1 Tax=Henriciella marina TaxID=453851 RepID=UPI0012E9AE43|nr:GNAT family N-acetyltransferase [Henriciella marina]